MLSKHSSWLTLQRDINIFMLILTIPVIANALEEIKKSDDNELNNILGKYINKIPDIKSEYVVNEELSKFISNHYKGKIQTLPLFKISLKIDRNPVKIPWILGEPNQNASIKTMQYSYIAPKSKIIKSI